MVINASSVQHDDGLLPDVKLLTLCDQPEYGDEQVDAGRDG